MDFPINLKRRDSGDSLTEEGEKALKKHPKNQHTKQKPIPKHPPCLNLTGRKKKVNHQLHMNDQPKMSLYNKQKIHQLTTPTSH